MKLQRRNPRNRKAFTLLEVLMVVVIIGLLAAFVVPQFFNTEEQQKKKLTTALIKSGVNGTLDRYRLDMGRYPTTDEGLLALVEAPEDEEEAAKWGGPYIKKAEELKDSWGRDLVYECPGQYNEDSYDLSSQGKNVDDSSDDITNWEKS